MISPQTAILWTLGSIPGKRIEGKKRLQKLIRLLKLAGADIDADYGIFRYGPFSSEIADAAAFLAATGKIVQSLEDVGIYGTYKSVFSLTDSQSSQCEKWPPRISALLAKLDEFSTIELEVASTIGHFKDSLGVDEQTAIEKTKTIKPQKTVGPVLDRARQILGLVAKTAELTSA